MTRRVWPVFAVYAGVLSWLLAANVVLVAAAGGGPVSPGLLVASLALNSASLAIAAWLAGGGRAQAATRLRLGPGHLPARAIVLGVAGLLALGQALDSLLTLAGVRESGALRTLDDVIGHASGLTAGLVVVVAGGAAPAAEEIFFRGFMQTRLLARWRPGAAIAITAVAFGLMHLDPLHGAFALVVGLYLGWLTERAGSIRPALGAHVANNLLSLAQTWLSLQPGSRALQAASVGLHLLLAAVAVGLLQRERGASSGSSRMPGSSSEASSSSR